MRSPEMRKKRRLRSVCAPHSRSAATSISPKLSFSIRVPLMAAPMLLELAADLDEPLGDALEGGMLLLVLQRAVRLERLVCGREGQLPPQPQHGERLQDLAKVPQAAQAAIAARRRRGDSRDLALVRREAALAAIVARDPVDGVLEERGHGGIVLRRDDEECVVLLEQRLQLPRVLRHALARLEVAVIEGDRIVVEVDERRL